MIGNYLGALKYVYFAALLMSFKMHIPIFQMALFLPADLIKNFKICNQ